MPEQVNDYKSRFPGKAPSLRKYGVLIIHLLSIIAVTHLAWVCFVLKTPEYRLPKELEFSALLFLLVYAFMIIVWIVDIPFSMNIPRGVDEAIIINHFLYESITYISPFKAFRDPKTPPRNDIRLFELIRNYYFKETMMVVSIAALFLFGAINLLYVPNGDIGASKVTSTALGLFSLALVTFSSSGMVLSILFLRSFCFLKSLISNLKK